MGLTANVVAGAPILSTWGNEIRNRSVQVFASAAERAAQWTSPPEGACSFLTDTDRVEVYNGSAWVRVAWVSQTGRTGVVRRRAANQSIPHNTLTAESWDTTDFNSDAGFITNATTFTIPATLDGLYALTYSTFWGSGGGSEIRKFVQLNINSGTIIRGADSYEDQTSVSATVGLSAGATIVCQLFQNSGAAVNSLAAVHIYRIGP